MIVPRYAAAASVAPFLLALLVSSASAHGGGRSSHAVHSSMLVPLATTPLGNTRKQPPARYQTSLTTLAPPSVPMVADAPGAARALADPSPQAPAIAPLSPPVTTTFLGSGGGTVRPDALSAADPTSSSPTEAAPSMAGGGGDTFAACMGFWERETHMSKQEWRASCTRVQHRFDGMKQ